ncbi:MAG: inositol monophosphatase [Patescibacteria group bacterium]|nr:inositol monophosphatase [Patescibacteria group bacterium]
MSVDAFIKKIATEAGDHAWARFGKDRKLYMKSNYSFDVVTKADLSTEKFIISAIRKAYPIHGIIAEESGKANEGAEYVWYIDPIDGTENFSRGIPLFAVMIALARRGRIILSAIYIPVNKELFFAKAGKGAYLNGKRIHCSTKKDFKRSHGFSQLQFRKPNTIFLKKLLALKGMEHFGVATYNCIGVNGCYTASGRRDWVAAPLGGIHDFPAPFLILKESGCVVTTLSGKPWTPGDIGFLAANPALHRQLLQFFKDA